MIKRIAAIVLSGVLTIGLLSGCGGNAKDSGEKENKAGTEASGNTDDSKDSKASGGGDAEYNWTCGVNLPTDHPYYTGCVKFGELMNEKSGGRISLEVYPSAQLGNERDVVEALQIGSVDFTLISAAPLSNFTHDFEVFDFPYVFSNTEHAYSVLDSEIGRTMLDNLENYDLVGLEFLENGFYYISCDSRVEHPDDMKGVKIRSLESQMQVDAYNNLGANGIAMAFSEVYTALQNGTLNATGLTPAVIGSNNIDQVQSYITATNHFYAAAPLLMSKVVYDGLDEELQQAVREAAAEARDWQRAESQKYNEEMLQKIKDTGCEVIEIDAKEWKEAMVPAIEEAYVGDGKLIDPTIYQKIKDMDPTAK